MPLLRYFGIVGGCLVALMLASNWYLSGPPAENVHPSTSASAISSIETFPKEVTAADGQPTFRSAAAQNAGPIVIDTRLPTVKGQAPNLQVAASVQSTARDAYAELTPAKQPEAKPQIQIPARKKVVARKHPRATPYDRPAVAGLFNFSTW